jgi:H/ACA ribonucleoprotein complex non-core subunit NAF1
MHDQDLIDDFSLGANAYDDRGYNDYDFSSAGPSRPAPIPYDDPYSNEYDAGALDSITAQSGAVEGPSEIGDRMTTTRGRGQGRGVRGQHRGNARDSGGRGRGRGRGRGHGRGWVDRGDRYDGNQSASQQPAVQPEEPYDPRTPRPLSPTSLAIARATGQLSDGSTFTSETAEPIQHATVPMSNLPSAWQFQQSQMQAQHHLQFGAQQPFVQPHINPRFASQFGMNLGFMQPQFYPQYGHGSFDLNSTRGGLSDGNWADQWIVHGGHAGGSSTDNVNGNDAGSDHQPNGNS